MAPNCTILGLITVLIFNSWSTVFATSFPSTTSFCSNGYTLQSNTEKEAETALNKEKWKALPKNNIKWNALAITNSNISFQYEYSLNYKWSLAINAQYQIPLKFRKFPAEWHIGTARLSSWTILPEARYYFSKKGSPHGFYIAG